VIFAQARRCHHRGQRMALAGGVVVTATW
jgi:hypothetical protein